MTAIGVALLALGLALAWMRGIGGKTMAQIGNMSLAGLLIMSWGYLLTAVGLVRWLWQVAP